jgi:hypothetical protein
LAVKKTIDAIYEFAFTVSRAAHDNALLSLFRVCGLFLICFKPRKLTRGSGLLCWFSFLSPQVKDRVEFYSSTPVTVNVRVTMNDTLRFPVLTICNKNSFNMSQIRMLAAEAGIKRNNSGKSEVNIGQLIGVRGMDAKQLWDVIAHDPDQIIAEVIFLSFSLPVKR